MKDKDELRLETLFRSEHIPDDGFSRHVMQRVRRRIWVSRLALPSAMAVGAAIAFRPAADLVTAALRLFDVLPKNLTGALPTDLAGALPSVNMVPHSSAIVVGLALLAGALMLARSIED